jgi:hypothetical protein
VSGSGVHNA